MLTREDLQKRIWGGDIVVDFEHSLGTALNKVREALSDSPDHPRYIETLPRRGYRFIAPVQFLETAASPAVAEASARIARAAIAVAPEPAESRRDVRAAEPRRAIWPLAAGCAVVVLLAWSWSWNRGSSQPTVRYSEITRSGRVYLGDNNIETNNFQIFVLRYGLTILVFIVFRT
jgi:hypothetical protein